MAYSDDDFAKTIGAVAMGSDGGDTQDDDSFAQSIGAQPIADKPNPHELVPFLKAQGSGIVDLAKRAGSGLVDAVKHPLDAVNSITAPDLEGAYRTVRNIPIAGPAIDSIVGSAHALHGGDEELNQYKNEQHAADKAHEEQHPLTDFLQKSAGLVALPAGHIEQAGTLALDAFSKSREAGNDTYTALQDARNAGLLAITALKTGHMLSEAPGVIGRGAAKELGVSPQAIERYKAAPEAVNDASQYVTDPEAFQHAVDAEVAPINAAVDIHKGLVDTAKEAVDASKEPPISLAHEIPEHLDQQGAKLSELSNEAFDRLAEQGESFPAGKLAGAVTSKMNQLKISGIVPSVGPDATAFGALGKFKDVIEQIGEQNGGAIPAGTVKELIQNLDSVSKEAYERSAGGLSPSAAGNFAAVRRIFDRILKESSLDEHGFPTPGGYAEKMAELAPQVSLVSDMSKMFGSEPQALSALKAAENPNSTYGYLVRQKIGEYDVQHGTDFGQRIQDYYDAPKQNLAKAQEALANAQGEAAAVNKIGPNSTETVLKSIQGGRNVRAREQLEALSPELAQTAQDIGVANQLSRPTINGSRRVNTGGFIGGGIGGAVGSALGMGADHLLGLGNVGHYVGGAVGGAVGFMTDRYGGQAVKAALDAGIKLDRFKANSPYIKTLMEAAQESPKALSVAHYILSQTSPEYQDTQK